MRFRMFHYKGKVIYFNLERVVAITGGDNGGTLIMTDHETYHVDESVEDALRVCEEEDKP